MKRQDALCLRSERTESRTRVLPAFLLSRPFFFWTVLCGAVFLWLQAELAGGIFFVALISLILFFSGDVLATLLPFLTLSVLVLQCYDSYELFIGYLPLAILPVLALFFHFIYYRRPFLSGESLKGLLAVSLAVTLGGLGSIGAGEYFSGTGLYYVLGLGIGAVGLYLLFKSALGGAREYDVGKKFSYIMYTAGLFAAFHVFEIYAEGLMAGPLAGKHVWWLTAPLAWSEEVTPWALLLDMLNPAGGKHISFIQAGNNLSTLLLFSLPFPLYLAKKESRWHLASFFLLLLALYASESRGGLLMGGVLAVVCLLVYAVFERGAWRYLYLTLAVFFTVLVLFSLPVVFSRGLSPEREGRVALLLRAWQDFCGAPIFGRGIAAKGNSDLYDGVKGTMTWYHMMIPQIMGSMGLVGVAAYAYLWWGRARTVLKRRRNLFAVTAGLSYLGLFLMSQVNPGEFCPLPYGLLALLLFAVIENEREEKKN